MSTFCSHQHYVSLTCLYFFQLPANDASTCTLVPPWHCWSYSSAIFSIATSWQPPAITNLDWLAWIIFGFPYGGQIEVSSISILLIIWFHEVHLLQQLLLCLLCSTGCTVQGHHVGKCPSKHFQYFFCSAFIDVSKFLMSLHQHHFYFFLNFMVGCCHSGYFILSLLDAYCIQHSIWH